MKLQFKVWIFAVLFAFFVSGCGGGDKKSFEKAITAFSVETGSGKTDGQIDEPEKTISLTLSGQTTTGLVATFSTTGESVLVGTTTQVSGETANDFTGSVTYTVIAADGTTADYVVSACSGQIGSPC